MRVVLILRETGTVCPCRWFSMDGIYTLDAKLITNMENITQEMAITIYFIIPSNRHIPTTHEKQNIKKLLKITSIVMNLFLSKTILIIFVCQEQKTPITNDGVVMYQVGE